MELVDSDSERIIAGDVEVADSFWSRFRGLMFRRTFEEGKAILFDFPQPRKFSVHTFFVFFPIDLVYLDGDFTVLEVEPELSPFRYYSPEEKANSLVELPAKRIEETKIEVGDALKLRG